MRFDRLADWLAWQETLHPSKIDLGLERLRRVLARLQWQPPTCPVITIGGTNGKGSSVALTSSILAQAGYRVGTFSSPHLRRYNERIHVATREVSDASLIAAFERIDMARESDTLTFFEFNALAALLVFETACLDAIVLEVGMGGRLDAVNVVDADVALVTSVALDHCDWLGADVATIAREKAGIFRAGQPAIFGSRELPLSIVESAQQLGSDLRCLGRDFDWHIDDAGTWDWRGRQTSYRGLPRPALAGDVQFDNAAAVLGVLECLAARLPLERTAIERGLRSVRLPGRFQIVPVAAATANAMTSATTIATANAPANATTSAAAGPAEWILDVAHNPEAARMLAAQLAARPCAGRTIAVCGILADKDIEGIAAQLRAHVDAWIVTGLGGARSLAPQVLADRLRRAGIAEVSCVSQVAAACQAAEAIARPSDRIVVFGSFLTVGPALEFLEARTRSCL